MSLKRWAVRRDATEGPIVQALRRAGALVMSLDEFDLLAYFRHRLFMLDAKGPQGRATAAQERLIERGWPLRLVDTPEAALREIGAIAVLCPAFRDGGPAEDLCYACGYPRELHAGRRPLDLEQRREAVLIKARIAYGRLRRRRLVTPLEPDPSAAVAVLARFAWDVHQLLRQEETRERRGGSSV